jgi:hypothetical protein
MREAAEEIRRLRQNNEVLSARVETMNLLAGFLYGNPGFPGGGQVATEDVVYKLRKAADELETPPVVGTNAVGAGQPVEP